MADAAHDALAHAQISSLLSLYYHALDAGDFATLEREVMSEDAVWEAVQHASTGRVADSASGRDEVLRWFQQMLSGDVTMNETAVRHFINTHVIRVAGERAESTSYVQCFSVDSMQMLANGRAEAEHVLTPQGWRISRYRIEERITDADMDAFKKALDL